MKTFMSAVMFLAALCFSQAGEISARQAAGCVDESVSIRDIVTEVHITKKGDVFLNFGGRYPDQIFTAVIFRQSRDRFPEVYDLRGCTVIIRGTVILYKDKPEIILRSSKQLITQVFEIPETSK